MKKRVPALLLVLALLLCGCGGEPDPELTAKYEARYQQFKEIYPACKPIFEIIK